MFVCGRVCVCFVCSLEWAALRFHRATLDHHVIMKPWRNPRYVRMSDCMMDDIMLSGDDNMRITMVTESFCSFHFTISVTLSETGNMFPLPLWFWKSLPCSVSSSWLRSNLDLSQCRTLSQNSRSEQASSIGLPFSRYCQDLPAPQQWPIEEYLVLFLCKLISWHTHTHTQIQ